MTSVEIPTFHACRAWVWAWLKFQFQLSANEYFGRQQVVDEVLGSLIAPVGEQDWVPGSCSYLWPGMASVFGRVNQWFGTCTLSLSIFFFLIKCFGSELWMKFFKTFKLQVKLASSCIIVLLHRHWYWARSWVCNSLDWERIKIWNHGLSTIQIL